MTDTDTNKYSCGQRLIKVNVSLSNIFVIFFIFGNSYEKR
jgi:hypothetical protein